MKIRAFITHKQAEAFADCQDRFGVNCDTKSIALSDGMGSTWQQKIWAQLLVDTFIESHDWLPTHDSIKPLCDSWQIKVKNFIKDLKDTNAPENLIYRNERNLIAGVSAGATFVGIRFKEQKWKGSVLGDSCLIEWNENHATFYTSQEGESFDNYPDYFDSSIIKKGKGTPKEIEGLMAKGTCLFLVSDPFSEFLLEQDKQQDLAKYINQLLAISSHEEFEKVVEEWRKAGMHNDDTTLVIIEHNDFDAFLIEHEDNIKEFIDLEKKGNKKEDSIELPGTKESENGEASLDGVNTHEYIEPSAFIEEFFKEYYTITNKKYKVYKLTFQINKNNIKTALTNLFDKYSIIRK